MSCVFFFKSSFVCVVRRPFFLLKFEMERMCGGVHLNQISLNA